MLRITGWIAYLACMAQACLYVRDGLADMLTSLTAGISGFG
ncbi:MAG: hypothetical protein R2689_00080 [Microthrixaceae bacterium]